jgi:hypothetical protein
MLGIANFDVDEKLASLGIEIDAAGIVLFLDLDRATNGYVHHSSQPTAAAAYSMVSPVFARGRFPNYTLIDFLRKRPSMDEVEILAFQAVCQAPLELPEWNGGTKFFKQLLKILEKHELWDFFARVPPGRRPVEDHHCIRPIGFDLTLPEQPEIPGALKEWREKYRRLPSVRQMMVTTILTLYLTREDKHWMIRVPKTWHVADAVDLMRKNNCLSDWARLVGLYPGW